VWCTKYRKEVLIHTEDLKNIFQKICQRYKWIIRTIEIKPDHVRLFITTPPFDAPSKIAKILKGVSARKLFQLHPDLKKKLWQGHLWSPSYYCGTAGTVVTETIQQYITSQKKQ
jgi:putative transposase